MRDAALRRIVLFVPGIWFVATLVFVIMRVLPGDPAETVVGENAPVEAIEAMRRVLGVDRPLWEQYLDFLTALARLDLGSSLISGQPVTSILGPVLPHTIALALSAAFIGVIVGIPVGVAAAVRRDSGVDVGIRLIAALFYSIPVFYSGVLILVVFAVGLGWFPMVSSASTSSVGEYIRQLTLPAVSLGLGMAAYVMRVTRATVLEVLSEDYIRTARAKGLRARAVLYEHALQNALIPIVTVVALYLSFLLGGAVLTETVFNRPGIGKVLLGAIQNRDYILIQSTLVIFATFVMVINLLVDLLYTLVDPTIRRGA